MTFNDFLEERIMKKFLLALLLVAFVRNAAFAAVQNVKVGGSIDSTISNRSNFNLWYE